MCSLFLLQQTFPTQESNWVSRLASRFFISWVTYSFYTLGYNQKLNYLLIILLFQFSSVKSLIHVQLFATPWTAACQVSLSVINSQSLLKLISIKLAMPSNHLILCHSLLLPPSIFPSIRSQFSASGGQSIGISASASLSPVNIQDWFPLGWTGLISVQSKRLSRVFSNTTVQKHHSLTISFSLWSNIYKHDCWKNHSFD